MTYTEVSKREEMFDEATRFLLLREKFEVEQREQTQDGAQVGANTGESTGADDILSMPGALPATSSVPAPKSKPKKGKRKVARTVVDFEPKELVGYCSFRFDTEETLTSRDAEVVYW